MTHESQTDELFKRLDIFIGEWRLEAPAFPIRPTSPMTRGQSSSGHSTRKLTIGSVLEELPQVPGLAGSFVQSIVPSRFAAISLRSAGSQTRTVSA
jgi:hypothetical protein